MIHSVSTLSILPHKSREVSHQTDTEDTKKTLSPIHPHDQGVDRLDPTKQAPAITVVSEFKEKPPTDAGTVFFRKIGV